MTGQLPAAPWTQRDDLAALVDALGGENVRYVGGAVRDTLLGDPVKDIDLATRLRPTAVRARLDLAGVRNLPTGIAHGTITAVLPGGHVEITTLRRDLSTDGRRATVTFSNDWREDASRRDFTINALYADPRTLAIDDFFGGLEDLAAARVRFIGEARARIREDYLRILRYFRFHARLGSPDAHAEAETACAALAAGLRSLSRERISWELLGLLRLPDPGPTIARMSELGVLREVLPETGPGEIATLCALVASEAQQSVAPDPLRRLAALLPLDPELADHVAARLRLSTAQRKRIAKVAARDAEAGDACQLAYRLGIDEARDILLLAGRSAAPLKDWQRPWFPLRGGTIVARGLATGPAVARILKAVEERWIAEGFPSAERIEELLAETI